MRNLIKSYWKPFLFVFVVYVIALFTMLRDHVTVLDDAARAVYGYDWSQDWNRYSATLVGLFTHLSTTFFDISPLNQIFGIILLSISSLLLTKLFTDKLRPLPLLFSTFIGLTPFMLNAWQFHFDTPYICLAILVSILPYSLYWQKIDLSFIKNPSKTTTKYLHLDPKLLSFLKSVFITILCLTIVWTSFQPAGGIFLVIGLGLLVKDFIEKRKHHWPSIITFIICYAFAAIYAYITTRDLTGYRDISTFPIDRLFTGILSNLGQTFHIIIDSLSNTWAILLPLAAICLLIYACISRKSFRPLSSLFFLIFSIPFAVGAYLALIIFPIPGRTFVGICFSLAIFCLLCVSHIPTKKPKAKLSCLLIPAVITLYSFCTFSWSYGNALIEQDNYDNFRITLLMNDLANIYKTKETSEQILLQYLGSSGLSSTMIQEFRAFPITRYIYFNVQTGVNSYSNMGYPKSLSYYGIQYYSILEKFQNSEDYLKNNHHIKLYDCNTDGYKTLVKNYYHEIRELPLTDEETGKTIVCAILNDDVKNPQQDNLEKGPLIYHTIDNN